MEIKKVPLLGNSINKKLSIGSGGVIIQEKKVLLVRGKGGTHFKFPGGHIEDNENFKESAKREAMEEIGCEIKIIGDPIFYLFKAGEELDIILIHYLAEVISGDPKPSTEIEEVKWFDLDNLPENCFDNVKVVLEEFRKSSV